MQIYSYYHVSSTTKVCIEYVVYHHISGDTVTAAAGEGVGVGLDTGVGVNRDGGGIRDYRAEAADSAWRLRVLSLSER
jgi:hypothetical protein